MMNKFSHCFATIVLAMNLGEITLGSYLLVIWMVDLYYGQLFVISEKMWLSSFQCYILQSIIFNIYLLSPLIQCFLTLNQAYGNHVSYEYQILKQNICIERNHKYLVMHWNSVNFKNTLHVY